MSQPLTNPCVLCASTDHTLVRAHGQRTLYRCMGCGLLHAYPLPEQDHLPVDEMPERAYTHVRPERTRPTLRGDLKRLVADERYGLALPHRLSRLPATMRKALAWMFGGQMRIPPPLAGQERALDVGCGNGSYMLWLRELGWMVSGNEVDPSAVKVARAAGLEVFEGDLQAAGFPPSSFDVINFSSVLDHTPNPVGNVSEAFRLLKPGGQLVAHSPNGDSLQHRLFKDRWYGVDSDHLYMFSPATWRRLFEQAGFQVDARWTHSPLVFLAHRLAYAGPWQRRAWAEREKGRDWDRLPLLQLACWPISRLEDLLGLGETVYVRAHKP